MVIRLISLALIAFCLAGCVNRAGISGAAMMRVEVEVYKGPIGQSHEIQIGELSALLAETIKATNSWRFQAQTLEKRICDPVSGNGRDCAILRQALGSAADVAVSICRIRPYRLPSYAPKDWGEISSVNACEGLLDSTDISANAILADTALDAKPSLDEIRKKYEDFNRRVSVVASQMRLAAFRLTDSNVGYVPKNKEVRHAMATLNFLFGEMSNTIAARNLILQKLFANCSEPVPLKECWDASSKLPTSDYLRDVEPTRFMEAFDWFNADLDSSGTGAMMRRNRTRTIQALTDDYYWEKVNEVYTSGQGDVSMAFIKDELGNWNLKSYTNDPSKLLSAYRGAANAAISSAVKLARKAAGDPTAIARSNRALDLAERLTTGSSPGAASIGGLRVETLKNRAMERLHEAKRRFAAREKSLFGEGGTVEAPALGSEIHTKKLAEADQKAALESARSAQSSAETNKINAEAALAQCAQNSNCTSEAARLSAAIADLSAARIAYSGAFTAHRAAQDALAISSAEAMHLGDQAAELADEIIKEYQHDLSVLQQVVVSESAASSPVTGSTPSKMP